MSPLFSSTPPAASRQHVVLIGFTCSGKSTVGRLLAERCGRSFVDLDEVIARDGGRPIAELVRQRGVVALRARERALLRDLLAHPQPLVIAAGSDTYMDGLVREWLGARTAVVFLEADAEAVVRRLAASDPSARRPLKPGPNLLETVRRLLTAATPTYRQAALTVHNDGERIEDVVYEIARQLRLDRQEHGRSLRRAV